MAGKQKKRRVEEKNRNQQFTSAREVKRGGQTGEEGRSENIPALGRCQVKVR